MVPPQAGWHESIPSQSKENELIQTEYIWYSSKHGKVGIKNEENSILCLQEVLNLVGKTR